MSSPHSQPAPRPGPPLCLRVGTQAKGENVTEKPLVLPTQQCRCWERTLRNDRKQDLTAPLHRPERPTAGQTVTVAQPPDGRRRATDVSHAHCRSVRRDGAGAVARQRTSRVCPAAGTGGRRRPLLSSASGDARRDEEARAVQVGRFRLRGSRRPRGGSLEPAHLPATSQLGASRRCPRGPPSATRSAAPHPHQRRASPAGEARPPHSRVPSFQSGRSSPVAPARRVRAAGADHVDASPAQRARSARNAGSPRPLLPLPEARRPRRQPCLPAPAPSSPLRKTGHSVSEGHEAATVLCRPHA